MTDTVALSELCTHLQDFAEQERARLAHRLHDELGGLLTAAKMDLSWLQSRIAVEAPIRERLAQLGNALDEAMELKRRLVDELRPSLLDHFGLPTALKAHVESACAKAVMRCSVTIDERLADIPKPLAIVLFRVAQAALDNVLRHAQAQQVEIELASEGTGYRLRVTDNGRGMDLAQIDFRSTHGLAGMRHRVEALGGRFAIESKLREGTALTIKVPRGTTTSSAHPPRSA
jgi:signal transduction histidine kinase